MKLNRLKERRHCACRQDFFRPDPIPSLRVKHDLLAGLQVCRGHLEPDWAAVQAVEIDEDTQPVSERIEREMAGLRMEKSKWRQARPEEPRSSQAQGPQRA